MPDVRFARSDGVDIAYHVVGDGPIDLVYVEGSVTHLEVYWELPQFRRYCERLGEFTRLVLFDKRGMGMSDRVSGATTLEERMDDIRAVMDAAGSASAVIFGVSEGVALSTLFAATHPDRSRGLVLCGGGAADVQQPDYPWAPPREERVRQLEAEAATLFEEWGTIPYARELVRHFAPSASDDDALVEWFAEHLRLGASPGAVIALDRMNLELDVRSVLPTIRVPTLVLNRVDDQDATIEAARYLAEHIPGAALVELPGSDHFMFIGDQEQLFAAIERFIGTLDGAADAAEPESVLATVVWVAAAETDLTTRRAEVDRHLNRFRGRLVSLSEGGVLATFDGPVRAIRFAQTMVGSPRGERVTLRAGVQSGEVMLRDGGVSGPPVEVASRLAGLAAPGQLLATGTVRDLVAGSGIRFHDASMDPASADRDGSQVLIVDRESAS